MANNYELKWRWWPMFSVFQATLNLLQKEEAELMKEIQEVEAALKEEEAQNKHLKQQTDVRSPPSTHRRLQASATCSVKPEPLDFRCSLLYQRGRFTSTGRQRRQPTHRRLTWNHGYFTQWRGERRWLHLRKTWVSLSASCVLSFICICQRRICGGDSPLWGPWTEVGLCQNMFSSLIGNKSLRVICLKSSRVFYEC